MQPKVYKLTQLLFLSNKQTGETYLTKTNGQTLLFYLCKPRCKPIVSGLVKRRVRNVTGCPNCKRQSPNF